MTENMITVALIVGDPGHEGLQLDEGSLAAVARMIEALGAATQGRWDAGGGALRGASTSARPRRGSQGRTANHLGRQA